MSFTFCPQTESLVHVVNFILDTIGPFQVSFSYFLQVNFQNLVLFSQQRLFILNNCACSRCIGHPGVDESPEHVLQQCPTKEIAEVGLVDNTHFQV